MTKENLLQHLQECCDRMFGCSLEMATEKQVYRAVCVAVRELLEDERRAFVEQTRAQEKRKQVYYMSMEFLVGTSLRNNLFNMGLLEPAGEILNELGFSLERLCALEPDAGLGNGGLGRLASCYMDAATGLGYPVTGFSIRYEFGIFRQKIVDGWQMEFPDNWLEMGDVWLHPRKDDAVEVRFGGQVHEWMDGDKFKTAQTGYQSVIAVPHDLYISGYNSTAVNKLTLWSASMPQSFDMNAFSRGDYVRALEQNTMAEAISKVLYPADNHINGKRLRLRQQYLLVSSSLQSILNEHLKNYHTLDNLADKVAVHINDTHPALCVPELMRLLVDEYDYGWDRAWEITCAHALLHQPYRHGRGARALAGQTCSGSSCRAIYVDLPGDQPPSHGKAAARLPERPRQVELYGRSSPTTRSAWRTSAWPAAIRSTAFRSCTRRFWKRLFSAIIIISTTAASSTSPTASPTAAGCASRTRR